jgi:hypothetical protein
MSISAAQQDPEDRLPSGQPLLQQGAPGVLLHRDLSTQNQITMLLQVSGILMNSLLSENAEALDANVKTSLESTFIRACNRLDNILDDGKRWNSEFQDRLEKHMVEYQATSVTQMRSIIAEAESRKAVSDNMLRPSFLYKPYVVSIDNVWCAYLGPDVSLSPVGVGPTPEAALVSFDEAFRGHPMEASIAEWLHKKQVAVKHGLAFYEPFPGSQQQEQKNEKTMDSGRDGNPPQDDTGKNGVEPDSQDPRS